MHRPATTSVHHRDAEVRVEDLIGQDTAHRDPVAEPDGSERQKPCRFGPLRAAGLLGGPPLLMIGLALPALPGEIPLVVALLCGVAGLVLMATGLLLTFLAVGPTPEPRVLGVPVEGRWVAVNSPASHVPSHGTNEWGQAHALDIVPEPEPGARPEFGTGAGFRTPTEYPGFGAPITAPADAIVSHVCDGRKDHLTRSGWPALVYMAGEGMVRSLMGAPWLFGNHVVLDLGDDSYLVLAHLQRSSIVVRPGHHVAVGDLIARCGNSGNSSEPHLHLQLMDRPTGRIACGLPFEFDQVDMPEDDEAVALELDLHI